MVQPGTARGVPVYMGATAFNASDLVLVTGGEFLIRGMLKPDFYVRKFVQSGTYQTHVRSVHEFVQEDCMGCHMDYTASTLSCKCRDHGVPLTRHAWNNVGMGSSISISQLDRKSVGLDEVGTKKVDFTLWHRPRAAVSVDISADDLTSNPSILRDSVSVLVGGFKQQ